MLLSCFYNKFIRFEIPAEYQTWRFIRKKFIYDLDIFFLCMHCCDIGMFYISAYLDTSCIEMFKESSKLYRRAVHTRILDQHLIGIDLRCIILQIHFLYEFGYCYTVNHLLLLFSLVSVLVSLYSTTYLSSIHQFIFSGKKPPVFCILCYTDFYV